VSRTGDERLAAASAPPALDHAIGLTESQREVWLATQTLPANNAAAGLPPDDKIVGNLVTSVLVEGGAIHMTFGNRASGLLKGKILTFRPAIVEDAPIVPIAWICGYASAPDKMTAKGENKTNIDEAYVPWNCRAK